MKYDIAIIGSGPGGFSASVHLARFKKKICIIEKDTLGGTCLNIGCIPTKNLVAGRHYLSKLGKLSKYGITFEDINFDFKKLKYRLDELVSVRRDNEEKLFHTLGIDYYKGNACFIDPHTIEIKDNKDSKITINADYFLLASGSRPVKFPGVNFGKNILDSAGALSLKEVPDSFVVIGGGVIGCELAQIFSTFGSKVTIIEALESIIPQMDIDQQKTLKSKLEEQNIKIYTGKRVADISDFGTYVRVSLENGENIDSKKVLICIGRKSNLDNLNIEQIEINTKEDRIVVGPDMRTNIPSVYAVGDIVEGPQLASKGVYEGFIAAENLLGLTRKKCIACFPQCVFTDPQLASIGMSEDEAKNVYSITTISAPFLKNAYAEAYDCLDGFIKIIIEESTEKVLGVHIVGEAAIDLIGQASIAVNNNFTISQWLDIGLSLPHPSYSEVLRDVIRAAYCNSLECTYKQNIGEQI